MIDLVDLKRRASKARLLGETTMSLPNGEFIELYQRLGYTPVGSTHGTPVALSTKVVLQYIKTIEEQACKKV